MTAAGERLHHVEIAVDLYRRATGHLTGYAQAKGWDELAEGILPLPVNATLGAFMERAWRGIEGALEAEQELSEVALTNNKMAS